MRRSFNLFTILFFLMCPLVLAAEAPPAIFTGSTIVQSGQTAHYTFTINTSVPGGKWTVSLGDLEKFTNPYFDVATNIYHVDITWADAGSNAVVFLNGSNVIQGSYPVTVNAVTPPVPSATFSTSFACGVSATVTRSEVAINQDWYWQTSPSGTSIDMGSSSTIVLANSGDLYLRARSSYAPLNWSTSSQYVGYIQIPAMSAGGTISPITEEFNSSASGTISLSNQVGAIQRWEQKTETGNWSALNFTSSMLSFTGLTSNTTFRAIVKNANCSEVPSQEATVLVYGIPVINSVDGRSSIGFNESITLNTQANKYTYQWYKDDTPVAGATSHQLVISRPGNYTVKVKATASLAEATSTGFKVTTLFQEPNGPSYVMSNEFQKESDSDDLFTISSSDYTMIVQYLDGQGRPLQTVMKGNSPSGHDVVQPFGYDEFGREKNKYLPFTSTTSSGKYVVGGLTTQNTFYASPPIGVASDGRPYSEVQLEASPLSRPLKEYGTGIIWKNEDKAIARSYEVNSYSPTSLDKVFSLELVDDNIMLSSPRIGYVESDGSYSSGQLTILTTTDEAGNIVKEYQDRKGTVILKKVQSNKPTEALAFASTYYIYDDFGNLVLVLPPEGLEKLKASLNLN